MIKADAIPTEDQVREIEASREFPFVEDEDSPEIDPQKNPFVAYLANVNQYPGAQTVYYVFLSILHGLAMPIRQNDWVYEKRISEPEYMQEKLTDLGKCFCASAVGMADADAFAIEEDLQPVQLKLIWLMGQI